MFGPWQVKLHNPDKDQRVPKPAQYFDQQNFCDMMPGPKFPVLKVLRPELQSGKQLELIGPGPTFCDHSLAKTYVL